MHLYLQPDAPLTDSNLYTDIGVANDISLWLNDRHALAEATGGLQPGQVFERVDQPIENIETPQIARQSEVDHNTTAHGLHPQWHFVTVESPVPMNAYIGELKGLIGRKKDYCLDPSNRWDLLKHPEPFVFFPPHLPIYIDTRHEGTNLRYVRRSCNPNVQMKILTHASESGYHFCLIATRDIEAGEEVTMGWEIDSDIRHKLKEGLKKIEPWVACLLANFGGCACDKSRGRECLLERARRPLNADSESTPVAKSTKGRKPKKPQVSPLSTGHATNSRAGSEAYNRNGVDDDQDNRSTSGSHKSTSRDITPATHFSLDGGDMKMSDRERRKIQQQERLFEQLEYDEQHKGKRGKRNSAGSNLNTPSLSSSVRRSSRPSVFEANADEQKQLGQPEPSPSGRHREHSYGVARKASGGSRVNDRLERRPKPVYVDSATQTEDHLPRTHPRPSSVPRTRLLKRPLSFKHKLLQQAMEERIQREERMKSTAIKTEARSPALRDVASTKPSPSSPLVPQEESKMDVSEDAEHPAAPAPVTRPDIAVQQDTSYVPSADVEMKDADVATEPRPPSPKVEEMPDALVTEQPSKPPQPPPLPELSTDTITSAVPFSTPDAPPSKPIDLQVQPPSSTVTPVAPSSVPLPAPLPAPGSLTGNAIAHSPGAIAPAQSPLSPAVSGIANPGPARKKLSLSDYTSRRAKLAQTQSSGTGATPPLAQSHPTSSPTLSTTSLPSQTSPPAKKSEPVPLTTVAEEARTNS
jgi:hypothetical protein